MDSFNGNKVLDVTLQNQQGSVLFRDGILTFQPSPELLAGNLLCY
ncbi:hypothetical protein [Alishewanella longhuensis]